MIARFSFLILFALLVFAPTAPAKTFKIATVSPDGLSWMKKMRAGTKAIRERTDGRVEFKIYPPAACREMITPCCARCESDSFMAVRSWQAV